MKYLLFLLLIILPLGRCLGQQIPLKGIVTVQNSRVNTGKTEYVSDVSVIHPNAKPTATDSRGAFTLQILHIKNGTQTAIEVKPTGWYKDYVVVDERLIQDITLGRTTPVRICIQDKKVLSERKSRLIAVTIKKQNEIRERKIAALNKRIADLEAANDYANEQYQKSIDSLTMITNDKSEAIKRIREYAKDMVLINLDEADSVYRQAYRFFEEGELDSVASYLRRHINFEAERKQIEQQLSEARDKKSLARELDEQAGQQLANAEGAQEQLLKKLLLAAKASAELYNHGEAMQYCEQALSLFPENPEVLWRYASYLLSINESQRSLQYFLMLKKQLEKAPQASQVLWGKTLNALGRVSNALRDYKAAQGYFTKSLGIYEQLASENPKVYLPDLASSFNNLGVNYSNQKDYVKSAECYSRAIAIDEQLASENPKVYLPDLASFLNNLGDLYREQKDYVKSAEYCNRALSIYEPLASESPKVYQPYLASCLYNLGINYSDQREYAKASEYYSRALAIREQLASENPKVYLPNLASSLNNLGVNYRDQKDYVKSAECYGRAIAIYEQLASENPKVYLPNLASSLNNLGVNYRDQKDYVKSAECYGRAIAIYEQLASENPKVYLPDLASSLNNLGINYSNQREYVKASEYYSRALAICEQLAAENPKVYFSDLAFIPYNLGIIYDTQREYAKASDSYHRATAIFEQLAKENPSSVYQFMLIMSLNRLGGSYNAQGNYAKATEYHSQELALCQRLVDQDPERYLFYLPIALQSLASNYKELKKYRTAHSLLLRSLEGNKRLAQDKSERNTFRLVNAYYNLADISLYTHNYVQAETCMIEALRLNGTLETPKEGLERSLAPALLLQGKYSEAWGLYKKLVDTPNPSMPGKTFGHGCLSDLEHLTSEGLIPRKHQSEVAKVVSWLRKSVLQPDEQETFNSKFLL